jgi:2-methylcitrate dehydratase PrpD
VSSVSETFARFVSETGWETLPQTVRHETKRALLNFIGCALAVADDEAIVAAVRVLSDYSGAARVGLIGRPERLDVMGASFVNAVAGNFLDFDDTHLATVIHPTAPVAPVGLALAERDGRSGADMLAAIALGMEIECRVGLGVAPGQYDRGWHVTATAGVFGAAIAAAKLLGLSPELTAHALGVAASQSAGSVENLPTAAKNVGVGNAARNGVFAALMAREGYAAAPAAIEGRLGWARGMGDEPDIEAMTGDLGQRWEILRNTYKPYPAGVVFHAVIDAGLAIRQAPGFDVDQIERVVVAGDALLLSRGDRAVANERDARVSIHHSAAIALKLGRANMAEFSPPVVFDPAIMALRERVRAQLDPSLPRAAARMDVTFKDGRRLTETVIDPKGGEGNPLSDAEIEAKVRALAAGTSAEKSVDALIELIWRLDEVANVQPEMALLLGHGE